MSDMDPEVLEDIQLRNRSQYDRSRSGEPNYAWSPPAIVTKWKCRTPPCKEFVDVTDETMVQWEMFNRVLKQRGEKPLESHAILWCESCLAKHREIRPDKLRRRVERMADVIKQLKAGDKLIRYKTDHGDVAANEHEALKQLREWGHPDVAGLEQALAEKRSSNKKPTRGYV